MNSLKEIVKATLFVAGEGIELSEFMEERFSTFLQELRDAPKAEGCPRIYTHGEKEVFAYKGSNRLIFPSMILS